MFLYYIFILYIMSKIKFGTKLRLTASTKVYRDPENKIKVFSKIRNVFLVKLSKYGNCLKILEICLVYDVSLEVLYTGNFRNIINQTSIRILHLLFLFLLFFYFYKNLNQNFYFPLVKDNTFYISFDVCNPYRRERKPSHIISASEPYSHYFLIRATFFIYLFKNKFVFNLIG